MNATSLINHGLLLAQEGGAAGGGGFNEFIQVFGFPVMMMITLYIVFISMPQGRERKNREEFLKSLKKNDNVVTAGGIFGTVTGFSADNDQVTLRIDDNVRIRVRKSSIEAIVNPDGAAKKTDEKK